MNDRESLAGRRQALQALREHAPYVAPAIMVTLLLAVSTSALTTFFAQDDITFLAHAAAGNPWTGLARALSSGFVFFLGFKAFGLDPVGFHLLNLALHLLNVVGVYALGLRCLQSRQVAAAAALLFGASSIAFAPLHWASGLIELLSAQFLIVATVLFTATETRRPLSRPFGVLAWVAAMFSKETAAAWPVAIGLSGVFSGWPRLQWRSLLPLAIAAALFLWMMFAWQRPFDISPTGAYAIDVSPEHLFHNLSTYAMWCVNLTEPIRDLHALPDRNSWWIGLPAVSAAVLLARNGDGPWMQSVRFGLAWWLSFLLPVLPLQKHTYLYYLYIPWIGGAILVASAGRVVLERLPRPSRAVLGALALVAFTVVEWRNGVTRATAVRDDLPIDRTIRDSELLRHSLEGLETAHLPAGARVGFVNPTVRIPTYASDANPSLAEGQFVRKPYLALEAAMRGGETFSVFFPQLQYVGFATTIPPAWGDVECFYYEQRGWLSHWGTGQAALLKQAKIQFRAGRWAAADTSYRRVRALGDTLPEALEGQVLALLGAQRFADARAVLDERNRRWPERPVRIRKAR